MEWHYKIILSTGTRKVPIFQYLLSSLKISWLRHRSFYTSQMLNTTIKPVVLNYICNIMNEAKAYLKVVLPGKNGLTESFSWRRVNYLFLLLLLLSLEGIRIFRSNFNSWDRYISVNVSRNFAVCLFSFCLRW